METLICHKTKAAAFIEKQLLQHYGQNLNNTFIYKMTGDESKSQNQMRARNKRDLFGILRHGEKGPVAIETICMALM